MYIDRFPNDRPKNVFSKPIVNIVIRIFKTFLRIDKVLLVLKEYGDPIFVSKLCPYAINKPISKV